MTHRSTRLEAHEVSRTAPGPMLVPLPQGRIYSLGIWWLAVGYCAFYAPYSALARATSQGLLPGVDVPASPFVMLPAVGFATAIVTTSIVAWLGWWGYCDCFAIGPWRLPRPTRRTIVAGIATAAIIYATTVMFTFRGVSIVLALLIMRGGVLVLAPVLDLLFARRVRWFAWTGLALALGTVGVSAVGLQSFALGWVLAITAGTYLLGYVVRLRAANTLAKTRERDLSCRYFVEEQLVAMTTLVAAPLVVALMGDLSIAREMRAGMTTFVMTSAVWPALGIGALYAALYVCGTLIYLDRRENTFCVGLNRSVSLLAGVIASFALAAIFGTARPSVYELTGVGLILVAVAVLSPLHHQIEDVVAWLRAPHPSDAPVVDALLVGLSTTDPIITGTLLEAPLGAPAIATAAPSVEASPAASVAAAAATPVPARAAATVAVSAAATVAAPLVATVGAGAAARAASASAGRVSAATRMSSPRDRKDEWR